eukprot:4396904-Amphidinium_carterae.1
MRLCPIVRFAENAGHCCAPAQQNDCVLGHIAHPVMLVDIVSTCLLDDRNCAIVLVILRLRQPHPPIVVHIVILGHSWEEEALC